MKSSKDALFFQEFFTACLEKAAAFVDEIYEKTKR
jgi:hypothetical protein